MKAYTIVASLMVSLSGCSALSGISSSYPNGWPELSATADAICNDISGKFKEVGQYSYLTGYGMNLLSSRLGIKEVKADFVSIVPSSKALSIKIKENNGETSEKSLSESNGDFTCKAGAIVLPPIIEKGADGTGGYRSERILTLRRAKNGDLIGEDQSSGVGAVFWLVPIVGSQTFWYRWSAVN